MNEACSRAARRVAGEAVGSTMSKSGRFAPDFMIMQRRKEEEGRRVYDEKVKTDSSIGRVAHWEHKTANRYSSFSSPHLPRQLHLPQSPTLCALWAATALPAACRSAADG